MQYLQVVERLHQCFGNDPRKIGGIGSTIQTIGTLDFHFLFGSKLYSMKLYILPGRTPMLICHKDLDDMDLNCQTVKKRVTRVTDKYSEKVAMKNGLPYLIFSQPSYFTEVQLKSMHRNLGHPFVEKRMKVIEQADIPDLPDSTRKQLTKLVKHCKAFQLGRAKPRRFLFSIKDSCTGEFNNVIEVDMMKLDGK